MTRCTIKVKYIILLLLVVIAVLMVRPFVIEKVLFFRAENYLDEGNEKMAAAHFRRYVQKFPEREEAVDSFRKVLAQMPRTSMYITSIFHVSGGGPTLLTLEDKEKLEKLNRDFSLLKEHHKGNKIINLQRQLARVNYQAGNIEKAIDLLQEAVESGNLGAREELAFLYLDIGKRETAEEIIAEVPETGADMSWERLVDIRLWNALINRDEKTYQQMKDYLEDKSSFYEVKYYYGGFGLGRELIEDLGRNVFGEEEINLQGKVTGGGEPLENVIVFLQKKTSENEGPISSSLGYMSEHMTVSDSEGIYEFRGIEPGEYFMGIGASYYRIDDYFLQAPDGYFDNSQRGPFGSLQLGEETVTENIKFREPFKIIEAPEKGEVFRGNIEFSLVWEY